jgi:hypothetical protein
MPVELTNPAVVPASESATYSHAWFPRIEIDAPDPNGEAEVHADIVPFRVLSDGTKELMPNTRLQMHLERLFEASEFDPQQVAAVLQILTVATVAQKLGLAQAVMYAALEAKGKELGVI